MQTPIDVPTLSVKIDSFLHFAGLAELWNSAGWSTAINKIKNDNEQATLKTTWSQANSETSHSTAFCKWVDALITLLTRSQWHSQREVRFLPLGRTGVSSTPGFANGNVAPGPASRFQPDAICVLKEVTQFENWGQVLIPLQFNQKEPSQPSAEATRSASSTSSSRSSAIPAHPEPSSSQSCPNLNGDDVQLARYAMETPPAVGDRTHIFGMVVCHPEIVLWYYDRCGAVRSPKLNVDEPEDFLAFLKFLSAIIYMEDGVLGFNPLFTDTKADQGVRTHLCDLSVNIPDREDLSLKLTKLLVRRTGLVGRASLVYRAELQRESKTEDVVLKSSWQHVTRKSESTILTALHSSSQTLDCIVGFVHGWEQQGTAGSSRRAMFGEPTPVAHDRALRYTVTEYLNPLSELSKPFHIPHIGWSVLQAIKFLNDRGWFHRDIRVGNMGFAIVPECEGVLVKLHDFDLSKQRGSVSGTSHWTGTLPFMSIELLRSSQTEHMIGFDMEALLWTLLWIVRVYTDGKITFKVADHPLIRWFSNDDLRVIASSKQDYLRDLENLTNTWYIRLD
ncbi:hypothetical protein FS837_001078 [Tulasnella sp. UAMH 9824]|nr:hypothetical protein FS837_001078 [Tulasnella sp. UAMH 9824]